jgi:general secretion pathway protein D
MLAVSATVMTFGMLSYATAQPPVRTRAEAPAPPHAAVSFNLEDADLPDLVRVVSRATGRRFILSGGLRSIRASVYSPTDVTAAEVYQAFLSILDLNGMTVERSGRFEKIVDTREAERHTFDLYVDGETAPSDDGFVTRMHHVTHLTADEAATLLARFRSPDGVVTAHAPTSSVILTDTAADVRRMLAILAQIDVPRSGQQVWIEPIRYAVASDLVTVLTDMFSDAIFSDERTNDLIVIATEAGYLRIREAIGPLDVPPIDPAGEQR